VPAPPLAARILAGLTRLSARDDTTIRIENGVAIVGIR
jgi:hypothetical protein